MWFLRSRVLTFSNRKLIRFSDTLIVRSIFSTYIEFSNRKHTTMFIISQPCQHVTNVVLVYWKAFLFFYFSLSTYLSICSILIENCPRANSFHIIGDWKFSILDTSNLLFVFCVHVMWMHHSYNFQYTLIIADVLCIIKYPFVINKIELKCSNREKVNFLSLNRVFCALFDFVCMPWGSEMKEFHEIQYL